jgi:hypothetical protein
MILSKSTRFGTRTSSDVNKAEDRGDIAIRAITLTTAAHTRLQVVVPTRFRRKQTSMKIAHHALGVWRMVPYALAPPTGALASRAKVSVLLRFSKRMTVICAYKTAMRVGVNRQANSIPDEPLSSPSP